MFRPFGCKEQNNWFLCFLGRRIRKSHQFCSITYSLYDTEVTHFWPKCSNIQVITEVSMILHSQTFDISMGGKVSGEVNYMM